VKQIPENKSTEDFEALYIGLRKKEGRIYTDEQVCKLPSIADSHPHFKEWQLRKESTERLVTYLQKQNEPLKILEIGCGNGWLSQCLASIPGSHVTGTDINFTEVQQAARVFSGISNLHFIYSHAEQGLFDDAQFDTIVFAASIQYFPSVEAILNKVLRLVKPSGEIHIIDSHFYSLPDISAARQRSQLYFEAIGFPEMAKCYFHHPLDNLQSFNYSILYDPNSLFNRFLKNKHPFYWIHIKNKEKQG
jgi:ubiquinone/menaquinone biosynthesis C-methylase UbiE